MSTHPLLNGMSGHLQPSTAWSEQQTLELIQRKVTEAMSSLTAQQRLLYMTLQRQAMATLQAVEAEQQRLSQAFKTSGLQQLRSKLGGRDPEQYYLYTTYLEKREQPFPWEPRNTEPRNRLPRALDESQYKEHVRSMSLWEAACLNFGFTHSIPQESGFSLVEASEVVGPDDDRSLKARTFIDVARALDLGSQLQKRTDASLAADGPLRKLIEAATLTCFRFDALEAYRNRAVSGVTQAMYEQLNAALVEGGTQPGFDTLSLSSGKTPIIAVPVVPWETRIPLPLMLIKVASLGVLSYFPYRPNGALQYHTDAQAAELAFHQELRDSHERKELGWFSRQLPLAGLSIFRALVDKQSRPKGMNWLAGHLYDGFHKAFPKPTLDNVRFHTDIKTGPSETLAQALTYRYIQRYQSNLHLLAGTRSAADWQSLKDGAAAIAGEILYLLLMPLPGGVTGMNRIMLSAVMGSLVYSFTQAVNDAFKGDPSGFAASLSDIADLAISGRLIVTAGRAHQQRVQKNLQALGNPRKVTTRDGIDKLWNPDARPYAIDNQRLLDGKQADALGIYTVNGQQYAKIRQGSQALVVEVAMDAQLKRYGLKHNNGDNHNPLIIFDPMLLAWVFDVHNAHTLNDQQLLQRMLPNGSTVIPEADLEKMLRSTATSRTTLDDVWSGATPAPLNLVEGVRRLQVDRVIQQVIDDFHQRASLPKHADSMLFCLLTQLPNWPADTLLNIHDPQGLLIESYGATTASSLTANTLALKRREDGSYVTLNDTSVAPQGEEHLLQLIIAGQPAASNLGKDDLPSRSQNGRIALVREQVAALAKAERPTLFQALFSYAGHEQSELIVPADIRRFLPRKAAPPLVSLTPLLRKLRDLNTPLSPANLQQIMLTHPLSPRQQQTFLEDGTLPTAFAEQLDHHRTALRIDAAIDGLYTPRAFNHDVDIWAREFASALVRKDLKRHFVITKVVNGVIKKPYVSSGPDDLTVELRDYGNGHYEAYDLRNASTIAVTPLIDSFYLAIGAVLQPHERQQLGMQSATDAAGLRKTLGDLMSHQRSPEGFVSLLNGSLAQYEQSLVLNPLTRPGPDGILHQEGKQYLALFGSLYRIMFDKARLKWRLRHPEKIGVDTLLLQHNGEGAWRLASENPMHWDDQRLLNRLGHSQYDFPQPTAGHILALTDTPGQALRQVHSSCQPAPPLLADTCKRFKLEQQLQHLIQAMRTDPTSRTALPAAQLLILLALPGWPDSHSLQITDTQGQVLKQYPTAQPRANTIQISEALYLGGKLLSTLVMNNPITQGLLGELPTAENERLFKLVNKIVAYAERNMMGLLSSFYATSEGKLGEPQKRLKRQHPELPNSVVNAMIDHATPRELKQLHEHDKVSLRLGEQARLSAAEVRLNRAYEGLFRDALGNPDSDKITLHLLKSVAGWPAAVRVDIHQDTLQGKVIASAGHLDGVQRKTLLQTPLGYQAQGSEKPAGQLLDALVQALTATERTALGIIDEGDSEPLRQQVAQLALAKRVEIKSLLGLPHLQPWLLPPLQVDSRFIAYPMFTWSWPFIGNRTPDLIAKVKELYPSFSTQQARDLIRTLDLSEPAALLELERRQAEYTALETGLRRWADGLDPDVDGAQPVSTTRERLPRRFIMQDLLTAWRRETPRTLHQHGQFNTISLTLRFGDQPMPPASVLTTPSAFEHVQHLQLSGDGLLGSGDAFLGRFSGLSSLTVTYEMTQLPFSITQMTQLNRLDLSNNFIQLDPPAVERLAGMVNLHMLFLNHNPLGLAPDVSRMTRLVHLDLRGAELSQWPAGFWGLPDLEFIALQDNLLTDIPEVVFTIPRPSNLNDNLYLHGNPLPETAWQRINQYRSSRRANIAALPGPAHVARPAGGIESWLAGVATAEQDSRRALWQQLLENESPNPADVFQVLRDLTRTYAYTHSREALTARVWVLLQAMGESTQLRNNVFLKTYGAGNCGDSVLLAFTNMELQLRIHQAKSTPTSREADQALLALSKGVFYLRQLDQFSYDFIHARRLAGLPVDAAEVTIYMRWKLADEFDLPLHPLELLYTVESYVTTQVIEQARQALEHAASTDAPQEMLLSEEFWIEYLESYLPEPFVTISEVTRVETQKLNKEVADRQSEEYLERRQSIVDLEVAERQRLIRQLTLAAQIAQARP